MAPHLAPSLQVLVGTNVEEVFARPTETCHGRVPAIWTFLGSYRAFATAQRLSDHRWHGVGKWTYVQMFHTF